MTSPDELFLVTFGDGNAARYQLAGYPADEIGEVRDQGRLAMLYSAADVFVAPSRIDNLPNTLLEAQACGVPCVAFDIGGMRDIIAAPEYGALAPPFDVTALAREIAAVIEDNGHVRRDAIRLGAVRRFGQDEIVAQHVELYRGLLEKGSTPDSSAQ